MKAGVCRDHDSEVQRPSFILTSVAGVAIVAAHDAVCPTPKSDEHTFDARRRRLSCRATNRVYVFAVPESRLSMLHCEVDLDSATLTGARHGRDALRTASLVTEVNIDGA